MLKLSRLDNRQLQNHSWNVS